MFRFTVPAWLAIAIFASAGHSQDGYRIRIRKEPEAGNKHRIVELEKTSQKVLVTDADGNLVNKSDEQPDRSQTFEETILAKEPGKPATKLARKYEKVLVREKGKDVEIPLKGKTVTIERRDGKYAFKLDSGELSEAMLKFLADSFKDESDKVDDFNEVFFSKEPVKVGQTWERDPKVIFAEMFKGESAGINIGEGKATGKLIEIYQKDGHPYGRIDISISVPVQSIGKGKDIVVAKPNSQFQIKLHFDACIDGAQTAGKLTGSMQLSLSADVPLPNGKTGVLKMSMSSTVEQTRTQLK